MIFTTILLGFILIGLFVLCIMRGRWVLFFGICLIFYGMAAMYSVSIHESFQTTLNLVSEGILSETSNYYFYEQIEKLLFGLILGGITYVIPRKTLKKGQLLYFLGSLALMLLLFTGFGNDFQKGATLRLQVGSQTIQPGEFFKIGFLFFLVSRLVRKRKIMNDWQLYLGFMIIIGFVGILFFLLPDFGSLFVLMPVSLIVYRYIGGKKYFIGVTLILALFGALFASSQFAYVQERLDFFLNPDTDLEQGVGRQTKQALIAVGGGGVIGKGYGKGLQKFGYIPEAQSDFIFAAFAEEVGLVGSMLLIYLYLMFARHSLKQLQNLQDPYDKGMVIGLTSLLCVQAFVNIGVNIKLVPLTGITLPFVSHGGSALIINIIQAVLIHKILYQK